MHVTYSGTSPRVRSDPEKLNAMKLPKHGIGRQGVSSTKWQRTVLRWGKISRPIPREQQPGAKTTQWLLAIQLKTSSFGYEDKVAGILITFWNITHQRDKTHCEMLFWLRPFFYASAFNRPR